ncbi:MAG: magnesium/cobalt transporter CorA [Bacteroidota bacterium]|nr:magnesium/cobalt transporter CorA [Bacteroidota bacterium]
MSEKKKGTQRKIRFKKLKKAPPGSSPGVITISEDAVKPVIRITSYTEVELLTNEISSASQIVEYLQTLPGHQHWIEIIGFGDKQFFEDLVAEFNIHRLELEDVLSGYQRPKIEEAEDHLFIVSRPISYNNEDEVQDDQLSLFIFPNFVISLQEHQTDYFIPVRERLMQNRGIIRKSGAAYMGYTLMDAVVDNYFPFLERLGNFLDELEDSLLNAPDVYSLQNIQASKRKLILFRRIAWSEREKLNEILRNPSPLFSDVAKRYLRDTYDHTIQVMDIIESYREITASLMDIYLSSVSNRLNKVMKVLTIISTIFIPLTFIVGLYGMNFAYINPETGEQLPWNMPELYSPYGYIGVMIAMLIIVIFQIFYFYKKGWLDFREKY